MGLMSSGRPEDAQQFIGYLADFFSLYDDLKVWEYLEYFASAYKMERASVAPMRVDEVIKHIGLESKRNAMIHGLSRGMKQRLGIGRAIIHDPLLLILDEPAAGLDPKARVELKELLRDLHGKGQDHLYYVSHSCLIWKRCARPSRLIENGRNCCVLGRFGRSDARWPHGAPVPYPARIARMAQLASLACGAIRCHGCSTPNRSGAEFLLQGQVTPISPNLIRALVSDGAASLPAFTSSPRGSKSSICGYRAGKPHESDISGNNAGSGAQCIRIQLRPKRMLAAALITAVVVNSRRTSITAILGFRNGIRSEMFAFLMSLEMSRYS
jgi:energy-coupling factor transporter ATP-binding protein EcfA2